MNEYFEYTAEMIHSEDQAEERIMYMARVSNPEQQDSGDVRLLSYLIRHGHWSPFDLVSFTFEFNTTRDIGRQCLRHQTLKPQEFSQRYAAKEVPEKYLREARLQHPTNRQLSTPCEDQEIIRKWEDIQKNVMDFTYAQYDKALAAGIAKEQARALLPEGLTQSTMYFHGTLRSWLFFCKSRTPQEGAQKEICDLASSVRSQLEEVTPNVCKAFFNIYCDKTQ